jgi:phenylpyruvate tautomerase PptA (4-oxalocrotonate tautomerase family)
MSLRKVYHPVGAYSAQDKKGFAEKVTAMYSGIPIPNFYVVMIFEEVAAESFYVGGASHDKFVRLKLDHMAVYGLAAYVQSASDERANDVASRLQAGVVFVNGAAEDPEAAFGGYKMSGNGREFGEVAFGEFLETKAIVRVK